MSNKRNNELLDKVNEILTTSTNLTEDEKKTLGQLKNAYENATYKEHEDRHTFYQNLVSDMTNDFGFKDDALAEKMAHEHPTLQQSFTKFVVKFIRSMAKNSYTDGRNERAVALCKKLAEVADSGDNAYLPMI